MLHLTVGPMFADKTTGLITQAREVAKVHGAHSVVVVVPTSDYRSGDMLRSHSGLSCPAHAVDSAAQLHALVYPRPDLKAVVVDEVQLYGAWVVRELALLGRRRLPVYAAGLLHDYLGAPFENVAQLIPLASVLLHKTAKCAVCGAPAAWTHRTTQTKGRVLVGGAESYEARCREHWDQVVENPWVPWG